MSNNQGFIGSVQGPLQSTTQLGPDQYTLCLYWRAHDDGKIYWVDFELFPVLWSDGDGKFTYQRRDSDHSPDPVAALGEAEWAAHGFVKWDGCTQFSVGDVHIDNKVEMRNLWLAIEGARQACAAATFEGSPVRKEYGL